MIHAAEGVDADASRELDRLDRLGCFTSNTVLIHGVALDRAAAERVIAAGAGLVWCPSSNHFLFEATADVRAFDDADRLALGSDSRLSGERDLLDEIKVAHETRQLSAEGLTRTVTSGAAQLLRLRSAGRIANGAAADLAVIAPLASCPFDTLVRSGRGDIRLTMIDGRACMAEASLSRAFAATGVESTAAALDGSPRLIARWIGDHVSRMQLQEPGLEIASGHRSTAGAVLRAGRSH
jgi:cytosine/adenosine deaminase-related metal-dependent hydrolase